MNEMSKKVWINEKDWNAIVAQLRDAQARIAVLTAELADTERAMEMYRVEADAFSERVTIQAARIAALTDVLRQVQWCSGIDAEASRDAGEMIGLCPLCDQTEKRGHSPDCLVGAALAGSPAAAEPCAVVRLLNVARGCHDYGGGYRDPKEAEVFHHGIQTVINSLESAAKNDPDNYQVNVLEQIGAAQKAAESTPAEPQKRRRQMTTIFVTFVQEGWHRWPQALPKRSYLKEPHRHLFHFRVEIQVFDDDREIELHNFLDSCKTAVNLAYARVGTYGLLFETASCEQLAARLLNDLQAGYGTSRWMAAEVSEDGEVGARVELKSVQ